MRASAAKFKPQWLKVEETFIVSVLYHSDMMKDAEKFMGLSEDKIREIVANLKESTPENISGEERIVFMMMQIRSKAD